MLNVTAEFIIHHSSFIIRRLESAPVKNSLLILCALLVMNSCGKRGDPHAPELVHAEGAPTVAETRAFRPHLPPSADFGALIAALGQAVAQKLKGKGPEKFFLYRIRNKDGERYLLREGAVPASWLDTLPGTRFDLVAAFPDLDSGVKGWKRMERGFPSAVSPSVPPPEPWATTTCRPKR